MTKQTSILLSGTMLLSSLFFSGCGSDIVETEKMAKQPFHKANRATTDWTWNVDAKINKINGSVDINTYFYNNIPANIKHHQVFIDSIPNKGYNGSNGWEVFGADYLIEDTRLFISQSDTEWKWKYIGEVSRHDNQNTGNERSITLDSDTILADVIKGNSVNLYIEPYDANWVGKYYTIPLPNVKVNSQSSNIDEAYMKSYVKEQYAHAGLQGLSKYSTYYKMAAVSVTYHSPSYLDVYNFQNDDTPSAVRIRMNQNGLVDFSHIDIIGGLGSERISFRTTTRGNSPTVSLVQYDLKNKKVVNITVISGGAKDVLKQRLGESYHSFALTPDAKNAIVTTRDASGLRAYSLYDVRDAQNPTLTHKLFTEARTGQTRYFRILDNTTAEYTTKDTPNSPSRKVTLNFIQNKEI